MTILPSKPQKIDKRPALRSGKCTHKEAERTFYIFGYYFSKWLEAWKQLSEFPLASESPIKTFAQTVNYSPSMVSKIKAGKRKPLLKSTVRIICRFYEVFKDIDFPAEEVREACSSIGYSWEDVCEAVKETSLSQDLLTWWKGAKPKKPQTRWPTLPSMFKLVRREVHEDLKRLLVKQVYGWYALHPFVILSGMPRVGKTVLAVQIAQEVQEVFCDGVVWLSFGESTLEKPTAEQLAKIACQQVGLQPENKGVTWLDTWRKWLGLSTRRCCLILDDVKEENIEIVAQLVSGMSPRCVVLITTRTARPCIRLALQRIRLGELLDASHEYERQIPELCLKGFSPFEAVEYSKKLDLLTSVPESSLADFVQRVGGFPEAVPLFISECRAKKASSPEQIKPIIQNFAIVFNKSWEDAALNLWHSFNSVTRKIFEHFLRGLDLNTPYPRAVSPFLAALIWKCDQAKAEMYLQHLEELGLVEQVEAPASPFIVHKHLYRVTFPFWQIRHHLVTEQREHPLHLLRKQRALERHMRIDLGKRFILACQTFPALFIWPVFKLLRRERLTRYFYLQWGSAPFAEAFHDERFIKMPIAIEDEWQVFMYYRQIRHRMAWLLLFSLATLLFILKVPDLVPDLLTLLVFTAHLFLLFVTSWIFAWYRWAVQELGIQVSM